MAAMISMDSFDMSQGYTAVWLGGTAQRAGREGQKIKEVITRLCSELGF